MGCRIRWEFYISTKSGYISAKLKDVLRQCLHVMMLVLVVSSYTMSPSRVDPVHYRPVSPSFAFHPRFSELDPNNFQGAEGTNVFGFDLKKSVIILTPGLVQPPAPVRNHRSLPADVSDLCNFKKFSKSHISEKVRSYLEMLYLKENTKYRGGKKSGFKVLKPLAQNGETCHSDGLTAVGVSQMIQLGEFLARSYAGKLGSLSGVTSLEGLAETVGDVVLYQSLVAVLHGLLNDKQFVSSDVTKLSSDFTAPNSVKGKVLKYKSELHDYVGWAYKKEGSLFKEIMTSDPEKELPARDIIAYLSNIVHSNTNPGSEADELLGKVDLTLWDIDDLFNKSDTHHGYLASSSFFQMYANHNTYHLRQRIKEFLHLGELEESSPGNNLRLLAVDDLMMLSLLVSLNVTVDKHLAPASRLVLEVFHLSSPGAMSGAPSIQRVQNIVSSQNSKLKDSHAIQKVASSPENKHPTLLSSLYPSAHYPIDYIRILFNGKVITPSLSACSADFLASQGLCNSKHFQPLLSSFLEVNQAKVEL
nr:hypothetical protein BgiMline_032853 [Biomphalaria glabrata]